MSNITYGRDELIRLFSSWNTILQSWDDKKSHDIDSKYFQPVHQATQQLVDFSEEIHTIINEVANEVEST